MQDNELEEINQRVLEILEDFQGAATRKIERTLKKAFDPMLQEMLSGMGIDFSQLRGMASGQTAVDPYSILGLDRAASNEEIKKRYLELVHVLHPDKSGTQATGRFFQMVQAAYEMIKRERGWQ